MKSAAFLALACELSLSAVPITDSMHPNRLESRKRPFHILNPGMHFKDGKAHILYGTQGADGQPQTLAAILTRLIDYDMDPLTALSKPRFLLGKTFSNSEDSLKLETDVGAHVLAELTARGHHTAIIPAQSPLVGHRGTILIDPATGFISGAHDPRSDGHAGCVIQQSDYVAKAVFSNDGVN